MIAPASPTRTLTETRSSTVARALLEIGPGQGAITEPLARALGADGAQTRSGSRAGDGAPARDSGSAARKSAPTLILAERDRELAAHWAERGLRVEAGDFLELPRERWLAETPLGPSSRIFPTPPAPRSSPVLPATREAIPCNGAHVPGRGRQASSRRAGYQRLGQSFDLDPESLGRTKTPCGPSRRLRPSLRKSIPKSSFSGSAGPRIAGTPDEQRMGRPSQGLLRPSTQDASGRASKTGPLRNALELSGVDDTKRAEALTWEEWERLCRSLGDGG